MTNGETNDGTNGGTNDETNGGTNDGTNGGTRFDLNDLPDEVLFYSNRDFFRFVETCLGSDEMELMKIQAIKNTRALIHVPDVMAVIDLDCDEINELKKRICFCTKNNGFVIKEGFKCGIKDFIDSLKKKSTDYLKRLKEFKLSSKAMSKNTFNLIISSANTQSQSSSTLPLTSALPSAITSDSTSSVGYEKWISNAIENFSKKAFNNIILLNKIDYTIQLAQSAMGTHGQITCKCSSVIKLNYRQETSSFQLSAFYKHVRNSRCPMMKMKKKNLKKTNENMDDSSNESQEDNEEENDDAIDYNDDDVSDVLSPSKSVVDNDIRHTPYRSADSTETAFNLNKRKQPLSNMSPSIVNNKKSRRS